ncbi:TetR/AcrR family transcriptional regulator [Glaciimonas sp. PAMC28666]|uniref:TetR/AcrR family transcriptional regulator n=1 Tax=Glaciimonas sp. PAMC28666 TaxID=2807626 RepID=UPI001963DF5A|nr:TetR/AcrR family transcriptional regulator [Glaciimonas sp. PAMC28666]QRX83715.1 TetR family transcriptional regulator [Glaciimonas sp. PAMC28666]
MTKFVYSSISCDIYSAVQISKYPTKLYSMKNLPLRKSVPISAEKTKLTVKPLEILKPKAVSKAKPKAAVKPKPAAKPKAAVSGSIKASEPAKPNVIEGIRDAVSRLKRERIIAVAAEMFYDNGFNNTTLEAVAEKMSVTKPFIYSHFKSKNDLLAEICSLGIRASLDVLNQVVASDGSNTEKVRALVRDFMLAVLENQEHIAIYTREQKHLSKEDSDAIENMRREFDLKLCKLLTDGVTAGEFKVDDIKMASLAVGGIVSWSYAWYRPHGRLTGPETAERMADLVLAMIQVK